MGCCKWSAMNELDRIYHDTEWGVPLHEDRMQFEFLSLEVLQCGLNWQLMLKKREIFRTCFAGFDYDRVAGFGPEDVERILETPGMIRAPRKIQAIIGNAQGVQRIRGEFGSFSDYLWSYSDGKVILYEGHEDGPIPVSNELSQRVSRDLKARGFRYLGPVTVYSHLQACGIICDHDRDCPCFAQITAQWPCVHLPRCGERFGPPPRDAEGRALPGNGRKMPG